MEDELRKKTKATDRATSYHSEHEMNRNGVYGSEKSMSQLSISWFPELKRIFQSQSFEAFFAIAIMSNSILLGCRTHYWMDDGNVPFALEVAEYCYTTLFTIELIARVVTEGVRVFWTPKKVLWYYLDLVVVCASLVGLIVDASEGSSFASTVSNARIIRVVRLIRLIRLLRIIRIVRFVRALRTLVLSIGHTLRSVIWAIVLLLVNMYVFGLVIAQGVGAHRHSHGELPGSVETFWGTLPKTLLSLYKSITGGVSWHDVVTPLSEVDSFLVAAFLIYISFTVFAFMNVITGVFCEAAIESARQDHEMMVQQVLSERENFTNAIHSLFGVDRSGGQDFLLSYHEFENVLTNPKTKAHLAAIQLDISDAWELFKLLDTDESAFVDVEEFVNGCLRLKGIAKSIDLAKLSYDAKSRHRRLSNHVMYLGNRLAEILQFLKIPNQL